MWNKHICAPIISLFFISIGGLLLHLRIHPPMNSPWNWVPVIFGIITTFVVPFMFNNRATAAWAYLITLISVITGTISMSYFSILNPPEQITFTSVILKTTLADILILLAKLPLAQIIIVHWRNETKAAAKQ